MIKQVSIKNFRSIKDLEFMPNNLCALVGQNNVGKSNILMAIDLLLGEQWPLNRITTRDFYRYDDTLTLQIRLNFDTPIQHSYYGSNIEIYGFHLEYSQMLQRIYCLDENNEIIMNKWGNPIPVNNEIRSQVPSVLVEVDRDLERELRGSQWTIFGKLLREIQQDFLNDENRKSDYDFRMGDACGLLRTDDFNKLETTLREQVRKLTGFIDADLKFTVPDVLDHYRSLKLIVRESSYYDEFSALDMGAGIQSAIFISIMEAYRQLKRAGSILLIEEPEVYLYPHARRYFYNLLKNLAEHGNQIFYSTHSTEFVNLPDYETIYLVRKTPTQGTTICNAKELAIEPGSKEELKLITQFDTRRNELFFAKKVLLVEGQTERFSLPYLFPLKGLDPHEIGLSIIDTESKDNLEYFIKILRAFSIPFVVLHDEDSDKPDYSTKHIALNKSIMDAAGDLSLVFKMNPDFEGVFHISNKDIRKAIECCKNTSDVSQIPQAVNNALDKLISL
jgi:predicted ATP-dependent endonuclease of OLD family